MTGRSLIRRLYAGIACCSRKLAGAGMSGCRSLAGCGWAGACQTRLWVKVLGVGVGRVLPIGQREGFGLTATKVVTPVRRWPARPLLQESGYNDRCDIWSFGITLLEMAHGSAPFARMPLIKARPQPSKNISSSDTCQVTRCTWQPAGPDVPRWHARYHEGKALTGRRDRRARRACHACYAKCTWSCSAEMRLLPARYT